MKLKKNISVILKQKDLKLKAKLSRFNVLSAELLLRQYMPKSVRLITMQVLWTELL